MYCEIVDDLCGGMSGRLDIRGEGYFLPLVPGNVQCTA